jgi:hypothetical protein
MRESELKLGIPLLEAMKMRVEKVGRIGVRSVASLALVLMFVFASQSAAATWRLGAIVGSKTEIWNVGMSVRCAADTWTIAIPAGLDVDNGDSVTILHKAWWWDNRTNANAPTAYHNFTLDVDYQATTYPASYPATTHSQESGSYPLNVTITVQQNTYLFINWSASVIVPGLGGCTASESGYPVQKVYLG